MSENDSDVMKDESAETPARASESASTDEIEEFDLDNVEVVEKKVFG